MGLKVGEIEGRLDLLITEQLPQRSLRSLARRDRDHAAVNRSAGRDMPALNRGFASLTAQSHRHVGNRLTLCAIPPFDRIGIVKNQYFGDINDYRKYGILRQLVGADLRVVMCWMLTDDDSGPDGTFTGYLNQTRRYRHHDETLFDALDRAVAETRHVEAFEAHSIIPQAKFVRAVLDDSLASRKNWSHELGTVMRNSDLVFFDPDNGLEVQSTRKGSKGSRKYVYWEELRDVWSSGASILVYQHFPRIDRQQFLATLGERFRTELGAESVIGLVTSNVVFVLASQARHADLFRSRAAALEEKWSGQVWQKNLAQICP